jgi:hypothetical protein
LAPALVKMMKLMKLGLSHNDLGDAGAASLAPALAKMTELTKLRLSDNNLGPGGVKSLAPSLSKQCVVLTVVDLDREVIRFKLRKLTRLGKLMDAYCDKRNIARESTQYRFLFDGQRITPTATPFDLEMEDDDEIIRCSFK